VKTNWILEPLNEGQSMNCRVPFKGGVNAAYERAIEVAQTLSIVLTGAFITCRVIKADEEFTKSRPSARIVDSHGTLLADE